MLGYRNEYGTGRLDYEGSLGFRLTHRVRTLCYGPRDGIGCMSAQRSNMSPRVRQVRHKPRREILTVHAGRLKRSVCRRLVRWQMARHVRILSGLGSVLNPRRSRPTGERYLRSGKRQSPLGGHDMRTDRVRTLCYVCMCGSAAIDVPKGVGINLGAKLTVHAIKKLPGKTLTRINQAVGFRLITKFGEKGIINLGKMVPVTGGVMGGAFDATSTRSIGKIARTIFIEMSTAVEG